MNTYFECKDEKHPVDFKIIGETNLFIGMLQIYKGINYKVKDFHNDWDKGLVIVELTV